MFDNCNLNAILTGKIHAIRFKDLSYQLRKKPKTAKQRVSKVKSHVSGKIP